MVDPQPGTDTPDTAPLHTCRNAARSLVLHSPKYKSYNIVLNLGIFQAHLQKLLEKQSQELRLVMLLSVSQVSGHLPEKFPVVVPGCVFCGKNIP